MDALNSMFFLALQDQVRIGNLSFAEFQSRIKGAVPKGGIPFWEERFWSRSGKIFSGSMKVLKLRKKLARLFELKRLLVRSGSGLQFFLRGADRALAQGCKLRTLCRTWRKTKVL